MAGTRNHFLTIKVLDRTPSMIVEDTDLLADCLTDVQKLFKKLVECHDISQDYVHLERELFDREPDPKQGAYKTKNAVKNLRSALFPTYAGTGGSRWEHTVEKDNKILLILKKSHASQICLSLPCPHSDPDIYVDALVRERHTRNADRIVFTAPMDYVRHFAGRDDALERISDKFDSGRSRYLALRGTGGLGKTQTALEYARRNRSKYPGGVYWINAVDAQSVQEQFVELCRYFDVPSDLTAHEKAERVRDLFQQILDPSLIIFDNVTAQSSLKEWLPAVGECRVLMTTRSKNLFKSQFDDVEIAMFTPDQGLRALQAACTIETTSKRLAAREAGCSLEDALRREKEAIEGINKDLINRLPLTLILLAYYVEQRQTTFEDCRRRLRENSYNVITGAEVDYSLSDAFKITQNDLRPLTLKILSTAACFAGRDISPQLLRESVGVPDMEIFEKEVAFLDGGSFFARDINGRITLHELIRDMTYRQIRPLELPGILDRTAETLRRHLKQANDDMHWENIRPEIPHYRTVLDNCKRERLHLTYARLLNQMGAYYYCHDETDLSVRYYLDGMKVVEAHLPNETLLLAEIKRGLAAANPFAQDALRYAREALALIRKLLPDSDPEAAEYYNVVGYVLKMKRSPGRALPFYMRALHICEAQRSSPVTLGEYRNNIGALYEALGDYPLAERYLTDALDILEQAYRTAHPKLAFALNNLGRVLLHQNKFERALDCHLQAQRFFEAIYGPESKGVAASMYFAARVLKDLARQSEAVDKGRQALDIMDRNYSPDDSFSKQIRNWLETFSCENN